VPLQKHRDRCGCRASYGGSDQRLQKPLLQGVKQQSSSVVHGEGPVKQHLSSTQLPLQHFAVSVQEPRSGMHPGVVVEVVLVEVVVVLLVVLLVEVVLVVVGL
jgi:hypothetical protein